MLLVRSKTVLTVSPLLVLVILVEKDWSFLNKSVYRVQHLVKLVKNKILLNASLVTVVCILQKSVIKINAQNVSLIVPIAPKPQLVTVVSRVMFFQTINPNVQSHVPHHVPLAIPQIQTNALDALQELNSINQPHHVLKIYHVIKPQHVLDVLKDMPSMKRNVSNVLILIQTVLLVHQRN